MPINTRRESAADGAARTSINSSTTIADLASEAAAAPLEPPRALNARQREIFDHVVSERERRTWGKFHLMIAANLAVAQERLERVQEQVEAEGFVLHEGEDLKAKAHPLLAASTALQMQIINAIRTLGLTATQMGIGDEAQKYRSLTQRTLFEEMMALRNGDPDNLLALPAATEQ